MPGSIPVLTVTTITYIAAVDKLLTQLACLRERSGRCMNRAAIDLCLLFVKPEARYCVCPPFTLITRVFLRADCGLSMVIFAMKVRSCFLWNYYDNGVINHNKPHPSTYSPCFEERPAIVNKSVKL